MATKYKHSLKNQEITLKDTLLDWQEDQRRDGGIFGFVILMCMGLAATAVGINMARCDKPSPQKECTSCHNRQTAMTNYFKKAGSKTPEEMAYACLKTRSPKLIAAIAVVESGGNHTLKNTGYRKRHNGAFQVNPRHWGKVPNDAVGQALQAEAILQELTETYPIKKALSIYGGDSTSKYQRKVLAELVNVP
jgi:hypothetical protein